MEIIIKVMLEEDKYSVCRLLEEVITETYSRNAINLDFLFEFIKEKQKGIKEYSSKDGLDMVYKCAFVDGDLIGIGGIYPLCDDIKSHVQEKYWHELEIGSLYIIPSYQGIGLGKRIMHELIEELDKLSKEIFFLDCGYKSSQAYWTKTLGQPYLSFKNHFSDNEHYLIWKMNVRETKTIFKRYLSKDSFASKV